MEKMTKEQVAQKKEQLMKLLQEANAIKEELVSMGEWPLNEEDLDKATGGGYLRPIEVFDPFR